MMQNNLIQAEIELLQSILYEKELAGQAAAVLDQEAFYEQKHRAVFGAVLGLVRAGQDVDIISLTAAIPAYNDFILDLHAGAAGSAYFSAALEKLTARMIKRRLYRALQEGVESLKAGREAEEVIGKVEAGIDQLNRAAAGVRLLPMHEWVKKTIPEIIQRCESGCAGIKTGIGKFDRMTGGFQKGELNVIGARPKVGKTSLAINLAFHISRWHKVAFISMEMSGEIICKKFIAAQAMIDSKKMINGTLSKDEFPRLAVAAGQFEEKDLSMVYTANSSVKEISNILKRQIKENGLDLAVIDYLSYIRPVEKKQSREQEISRIVQDLKYMISDLDISLFLICQFNRGQEYRSNDNSRPRMSDFRESGAVENIADMITFLHNPGDEKCTERIWMIERYRHSESFDIPLDYAAANSLFYERAAEGFLPSEPALDWKSKAGGE